MKARSIVACATFVLAACQSLPAAIVVHNGTANSDPPGSGAVNVLVFDVMPAGAALGVSVLYFESAPWTMQYAFETGEPPVAVDLFFDENLTGDTWYSFRVDLTGANFVFAGGMPVPTTNPVGAGVDFTQPVACSSVMRSGSNASLMLHMSGDDALLPGDGATLSFFASGAAGGFTMQVTPMATFADSDGDGLPNECDSSTTDPVGACCDACLAVCQDGVTEAGCPVTFAWTDGAMCAAVCSTVPMDCDDGSFCTGVETCVAGSCESSGDPCAAPLFCSDELGTCVECMGDSDCDDNVFCNGAETCVAGTCTEASDPCEPPLMCDEATAGCVECAADEHCNDDNVCTNDACEAGTCAYTAVEQGSSCSDDVFCNGEETCDGAGQCMAGDAPCPDGECDEQAGECVEPGTRTICSNLGDNPHPNQRDRDVFKFFGHKHEWVTVRLVAAGGGPPHGRAKLRLKDQIPWLHFERHDFSAVSNMIHVKLPKAGQYRIVVAEFAQNAPGAPFTGDYCLTLEADDGAAATLLPTMWVED